MRGFLVLLIFIANKNWRNQRNSFFLVTIFFFWPTTHTHICSIKYCHWITNLSSFYVILFNSEIEIVRNDEWKQKKRWKKEIATTLLLVVECPFFMHTQPLYVTFYEIETRCVTFFYRPNTQMLYTKLDTFWGFFFGSFWLF